MSEMRIPEQLEEVQQLLDSIVLVMSTAIDARTPYNANHTRNMVLYAQRFLAWLDAGDHGWRMDEETRRQFVMCIWLHDVGKITVPLAVMDKRSRLSDGLERVETRFRIIRLLNQIALESGRKSLAQSQECNRELDEGWALVQAANSIDVLSDELLAQVQLLDSRVFVDENGELQPWLTQPELTALSVRRGTLTDDERTIMEGHVVMTKRMLSEINFPAHYGHVEKWAGGHHELLDGSGYPLGLTGEQIPREVRLLTLLDVFDALTAIDRPYKQGMSVAAAMGAMEEMAAEGKLDGGLLLQFQQSRAWAE